MNLKLQLIVACIIVIAMIYIIKKIRKGQVDVKYSLIWFGVGVIYLCFDLIPPLQTWVCWLLGISVPQNMLLFLAVGLILVILFSVTAIISSQTRKIRRLVQEIGILEKEVEDLKNRSK